MMITLPIYCAIIAIASLMGGFISTMIKLTHRKIQLTLSFVSGVMLGVALLHLLPHSIMKIGSSDGALGVCLVGLLVMFFLIRMFHFHQHDLAFDSQHDHKQKELCDDQHDHHHVHCQHHSGQVDLSWAGLCLGLAIHTIIDGIALAAAVSGSSAMSFAGLGVFIAIVLHKPLDALSITSLMSAKGWTLNQQMVVNFVFATMCPFGAILFVLGIGSLVDSRDMILGIALAFSAGVFLCISLGDLLPEVHFHSHDRLLLSMMLVLGVVLAFAIEHLPGHDHSGPKQKTADVEEQASTDSSPAGLRPALLPTSN